MIKRLTASPLERLWILGLEPEPSRIVHPNVIVVLCHLIGMARAMAYIECVGYGRNAHTYLLILFESCFDIDEDDLMIQLSCGVL